MNIHTKRFDQYLLGLIFVYSSLSLMIYKTWKIFSKSGTHVKAEEQEKHDTDNIPIFDTGCVHKIDIRISGEDWDDLQADPLGKTKYKVDADMEGEVIDFSHSVHDTPILSLRQTIRNEIK